MTHNKKAEGIAIITNSQGKIQKVVSDDIGILENEDEGPLFSALLDSESVEKALNFIAKINEDGPAYNWEMDINHSGDIDTLYFSGAKTDDEILIIGSQREDDEEFYNELMKINNDHINTLRSILKNSSIKKKQKEDEPDKDMFSELSKLNNELARAQRELAKKTSELERLNKVKNEMMGMASHDLRNPLGAIMSLSEMMLDEEDEDFDNLTEEQKEFISQIHTSSKFMLSLVEDMLDLSKIESGKINLDLEEINLVKLINHVVLLNERLAGKKDITISFDEPSDEVAVMADAQKMEQVLNNLITNAIKYSHPETRVEISLDREQPGEVVIAVEDEGQGIPKEEQDKLFKPFSKLSVESTGGEKSTGLGLAITRKIVEAHNGEISVDSEEGEGSTFFVKIPAEPDIE